MTNQYFSCTLSDSLAKFPRRTSGPSGLHSQAQQPEDQLQQQQQHMVSHNSNGDQNPVQTAGMQMTSSNGVAGVNNVNSASTSTTTSTIVGLLHQNSMNSRQQSSMNASSPYGGGSSVHIPSPGSSNTVPQAQPNASPFHSPSPSGNHIGTGNSPANISLQQQHTSISGEADPSDGQNSVQKIIHEMMMSSQMNGTGGMVGANSLGNDMKNGNGILPVSNNTGLNNGNGLMGNGTMNNNSGVGVGGYGTMGLGPSGMPNGMRPAMGNNSVMNGRGGMASIAREQAMNHQQDLSSQLLSGLGAVNGFNNLQFD